MEVSVEGEDLAPEDFHEKDWQHIHRSYQENREKSKRSEAPNKQQPTHQLKMRREKPRIPPQANLPEEDYKIVFRPRGGLDLKTTSSVTITNAIYAAAGVPFISGEQIRTQPIPNYFVVSTPSKDRAVLFSSVKMIRIKDQTFELSSHVAAPSRTVTGIVFNIPEHESPDDITTGFKDYNPELNILSARRMGASKSIQILFQGTIIPYWVRYRQTTQRCYPFRRKTEACPRCWKVGHRPDVCPEAKNHCHTCGTLAPTEGHPCTPKCVVCNGPHLTGAVDCPRRFQPRRRPPTSSQDGRQQRQEHQSRSTQKFKSILKNPQDWPNLSEPEKGHSTSRSPSGRRAQSRSPSRRQSRSPSANNRKRLTSKERDKTPPPASGNKQVSWGSGASHRSSNNTPPSQTTQIPAEFRLELASLKAEVKSLTQSIEKLLKDNQALRDENKALREQLTTQACPSGADVNSPPTKKRAVETSLPQHVEDTLGDISRTLQGILEVQNNIQKFMVITPHSQLLTAPIQQSSAPHVERNRGKPYS